MISNFLHAALLVTDLDRAHRFYGELLGLPVAERNLKFPGIWYQIGDYQLHLMVEPAKLDDQINQEKWGRNRHLAFAVENLASVTAKLQAAGYACQASASGRAALFVHDPDGNIIELGQAEAKRAK
jgi:glyoxylase I family protein